MSSTERVVYVTVARVMRGGASQLNALDLSSFGLEGVWNPLYQSEVLNRHRAIRHIFEVSRVIRVRLAKGQHIEKEIVVEEVIDLSGEGNVS